MFRTMKNLFSRKKIVFILASIILIVSIAGGVYSVTNQKSNKTTETTEEPKAKVADSSEIASSIVPPKPTDVKKPDFCNNVDQELIKQIMGTNSFNSTGRNTKTKNSTLTDCNYSKNDKVVNVRLYEYGSEADAKTDIPNLQIKGYTTKNKGKYVVSVLVVNESGLNTDSATKILNSELGKL